LFPELSEDEQKLNSAKVKVVVGQYFEMLGVELFGAKYGEVTGDWKVYPDATIGDHTLLEIKGGGRSYGFLIDMGQLRLYGELEGGALPYTDEFLEVPFLDAADVRNPFKDPKVYYVCFVHGLKSIKKSCGTVSELIKALSHNVLGAIIMPRSAVQRLAGEQILREYTGWCDSGSRGGVGHEYFVRFSAYQAQRWANGLASPPFNGFKLRHHYVSYRKTNSFMMLVVGKHTPVPKHSREVQFK